MSQKIDKSRRSLLKAGLFSGLTILIKPVMSDDLLDKLLLDVNDQSNKAPNLDKSTSSKPKLPNNQIISVRIWPSDVYTRLTIEATHEIKAKYFNLQDPQRFVIDILNSELNAVLKNLASTSFNNDPIISGIKVGQFDPTTTRIVVYAKQTVLAQTQTAKPVSLDSVKYKYRYIFDMYPDVAMPNSAQKSDNLDDQLLAFLQLNADNSKNPAQALAKDTAPKTSRMQQVPVIKEPVNVIAAPTDKKGKLLVMLDPGHGGEDPGAISKHGLKEKDVVLDIGMRLKKLIDNSTTMKARMTRNQDIFIPLGTRVAIARRAKADVFVSIHADSFTSSSVQGSSVFMLSDKGASSAFAKLMAQNQNAADLIGGMSFQTNDKVVSKILLDMTQGATMRNSAKLGQSILSKMGEINKLHSGKVEDAGFAVLKAPDIPSVLVESAFLSNPAEAEKLSTTKFRQEVAEQIFAGLQLYIKKNVNLS